MFNSFILKFSILRSFVNKHENSVITSFLCLIKSYISRVLVIFRLLYRNGIFGTTSLFFIFMGILKKKVLVFSPVRTHYPFFTESCYVLWSVRPLLPSIINLYSFITFKSWELGDLISGSLKPRELLDIHHLQIFFEFTTSTHLVQSCSIITSTLVHEVQHLYITWIFIMTHW